jgi:hypothetical protein
MRTCDVCGGRLLHGKCRECGGIDAFAPPDTSPNPARVCPLDGTPLRADGWCTTGDGFPLPLAHPPDCCPFCRAPLRWDGECPSCLPLDHKPGHRYDYLPYMKSDPRSAHWRLADPGPQNIAGPAPDQPDALRAAISRTPLKTPTPPTPKPRFP